MENGWIAELHVSIRVKQEIYIIYGGWVVNKSLIRSM